MEITSELRKEFPGIELEKSGVTSDSLSSILGHNGNFLYYDVDAMDNSYGSHYCIYRGIDLLAESVAQLTLQVYKGDTLLPPDYVLGQGFNLNTPHPRMSLNELLYKSCVYFWYRGELLIHIDTGFPFSLEPINPKDMQRRNDTWIFDGRTVIPEDKLIYVSLFNPDGGNNSRGLSPVDVVKADMINDEKAGEFNTKFFQHYGQIGGTLEDPSGLATEEQMKDILKQFNHKYSSSKNAHKTLALTGGVQYKEAAQTMREMQFLDSRRDVRDKILAVLGIHKALFGVTESVDRAVSLEATRQLWLQVIKPKAIRIASKLNQQLFKRHFPGYHCQFDFSSVDALKQGIDVKLKQVKIYRELGYTMNEISEHFDLGMKNVDDPIGDMRFVSKMFVPVDTLIAGEKPQEVVKKEPPKKSSMEKLVNLFEEEEIIQKDIKTSCRVEKQKAHKLGGYFSKQLCKVLKIVNSSKDPLPEIHKIVVCKIQTENSISSIINKPNGVSTLTYKLVCDQVKESKNTKELVSRIQAVYKYQSSKTRIYVRDDIKQNAPKEIK